MHYTGRAKELTLPNGKVYAHPDIYDPEKHDGTLNKNIPGLTQELAEHLIKSSKLHSFVDDKGVDFEERLTAPVSQSKDAALVDAAKGNK